MKICTPKEMREIEARSGVPNEILLESAGALAAREIQMRYWPELKRGEVAVFCGPGNNGADGLVVARHLRAVGVKKLRIYPLAELEAGVPDGSSFSLIIDALFGIGLNRPLEGPLIERVVTLINGSQCPVVSLDCPSGLDARAGIAPGAAVRASLTLTFIAPKIGFFTAAGAQLCGVLRVLPIGISPGVVAKVAHRYLLITERLARRLLPPRPLSANKSSFGHLAIAAGSPGFWGAGVLASQAAFRTGAGYVTWASVAVPVEQLKSHPEVLVSDLANLFSSGREYSAFVVGPGLGLGKPTLELIERLRSVNSPVVLDADALTVVAKERIFPLPKNWILTPHTGELSRLIGVTSAEIERDRFQAVHLAAKKFGCMVVLKGYRTLIASGEKCAVISSGNPALAKAGTGDVLAGMIGGFLAQGLPPWKAASLAAYLHGRLADDWIRAGKDISSLVASDLAENLPALLYAFRTRASRLQGDIL